MLYMVIFWFYMAVLVPSWERELSSTFYILVVQIKQTEGTG